MRQILLAAAWMLAVWAPRTAYPCGGSGEGGCDWFNPHVTYSLAEDAGGLTLSSVVQGCPGMRAAHQDRIEAEVARAKNGEACDGCPFGVAGLTFSVERTELGVLVRVVGPKERLAEFRQRYEAKMSARDSGGGGGCGCERAAKAHGPSSTSTDSGRAAQPMCGD